jgi:multidrug efflux system membrane fusion protein
MKPFWTSLIVIAVLAGGGFYWWKSHSGGKPVEVDAKTGATQGKSAKGESKGGRRGAGGPIAVRTIEVTRQAMPVVIDAVGTVESEHTVAIRPQVSGVLQAVLFKEGDFVKQGQVLFRIDQRPMQAAVEQARAAVARDEAQLVQAKAQEARLRPLMEKDYITRQEYDVAATQAKSLDATVSANRAALQQAQLQLAYGQINAPISGRTGGLSVRAGNLVTGGTGGAPLVVINSTQPILVSLSVPQRHLEDLRRYWNTPDLKVEISTNPAAPPIAQGALVFIDNSVNTQTGTILIKARVRNDKEELWPGQFVAGRIVLRVERDAMVLPEAAVQPGQDRPFVYVVRDGKAAMQEVQIARQIGDQVVIGKGLNGNEQIIAEVPSALTAGSQVQVRPPAGKDRGAGEGDSKDKEKGAPSEEAPRKKEKS